MMIVKKSNPEDYEIPHEIQCLWNSLVVYHGTWSSFSPLIEKKGWIHNEPPYDIKDIKNLYEKCKNSGLDDKPYGELIYTLNLGVDREKRKGFFFSKCYITSRNFANCRGGETIDNTIKLIQKIKDDKKINYQSWEINIEEMQKYYSNLTRGGFGVVYALEVKANWFSNWQKGPRELTSIVNINPECIKARIDFINGVDLKPVCKLLEYSFLVKRPW